MSRADNRLEKRSKYPNLVVADAAARGDVSFLISALTDPEMRLYAASHLGDLGDPSAVPALVRNLRVNNDLHRNAAVKALGKIGDPSAIPALIEVAEEDEASGVRVTAVDSLAMLKDTRGVAMLAQLALDPRRLIASSTRQFEPLPLANRSRELRHTRRWAAKRLRQLNAVDALPTLEDAPSPQGLRNRIRVRRTIRTLRKLAERSAG